MFNFDPSSALACRVESVNMFSQLSNVVFTPVLYQQLKCYYYFIDIVIIPWSQLTYISMLIKRLLVSIFSDEKLQWCLQPAYDQWTYVHRDRHRKNQHLQKIAASPIIAYKSGWIKMQFYENPLQKTLIKYCRHWKNQHLNVISCLQKIIASPVTINMQYKCSKPKDINKKIPDENICPIS